MEEVGLHKVSCKMLLTMKNIRKKMLKRGKQLKATHGDLTKISISASTISKKKPSMEMKVDPRTSQMMYTLIYIWESYMRTPRHLLTHAMKARRYEKANICCDIWSTMDKPCKFFQVKKSLVMILFYTVATVDTLLSHLLKKVHQLDQIPSSSHGTWSHGIWLRKMPSHFFKSYNIYICNGNGDRVGGVGILLTEK